MVGETARLPCLTGDVACGLRLLSRELGGRRIRYRPPRDSTNVLAILTNSERGGNHGASHPPNLGKWNGIRQPRPGDGRFRRPVVLSVAEADVTLGLASHSSETKLAGRLFILATAFAIHALAAEYCSVHVSVVDPDARPVEVEVTLRDAAGGVVESRTTRRDGVADFCDLRFGREYAVTIGGADACDFVSIRNIRDAWPHEQLIHTVFNYSCGVESWFDGCYVLLRVSDAQDRPLSGVVLSLSGPAITSDSRGRIFIPIRRSYTVRADLKKPGYRPTRKEIRCERAERFETHATLAAETH